MSRKRAAEDPLQDRIAKLLKHEDTFSFLDWDHYSSLIQLFQIPSNYKLLCESNHCRMMDIHNQEQFPKMTKRFIATRMEHLQSTDDLPSPSLGPRPLDPRQKMDFFAMTGDIVRCDKIASVYKGILRERQASREHQSDSQKQRWEQLMPQDKEHETKLRLLLEQQSCSIQKILDKRFRNSGLLSGPELHDQAPEQRHEQEQRRSEQQLREHSLRREQWMRRTEQRLRENSLRRKQWMRRFTQQMRQLSTQPNLEQMLKLQTLQLEEMRKDILESNEMFARQHEKLMNQLNGDWMKQPGKPS